MRYVDQVLVRNCSVYIIWNNKYFTIGGSQVFYKDWWEKGVLYIHDLCLPNGQFMSYDDFIRKYNLRNCFLKFVGLVHSIKSVMERLKRNNMYQNLDLKNRPQIDFNNPYFKTASGQYINVKIARS